jgi:anti-sigma B factor antagonist
MGPQLTLVYQPEHPRSLVVRGEIDIYTVPDLQDCLRLAVQGDPPGAVVTVDLSEVSFIDSRGLTALVEAEAYASVRGIRLLFARIPSTISRVLRITGLSLNGPGVS